jgi:O-acetyl-ADP-ribose deacetylase (regulator of RNase III)
MFAGVFVALYVAHLVGDQWVQTSHQAGHKGLPGWPGRLACAAHVTTYTLTGVLTLALVAISTDWHPDPVRLVAGLAFSAITHYIADRRTPLIRLATFLGLAGYLGHATVVRKPGADPDTTGPGTALMELDQSYHVAALFISSLIIGA